ncbi:hypothetical protein D3C83_57870 [compost metagenome]
MTSLSRRLRVSLSQKSGSKKPTSGATTSQMGSHTSMPSMANQTTMGAETATRMRSAMNCSADSR